MSARKEWRVVLYYTPHPAGRELLFREEYVRTLRAARAAVVHRRLQAPCLRAKVQVRDSSFIWRDYEE